MPRTSRFGVRQPLRRRERTFHFTVDVETVGIASCRDLASTAAAQLVEPIRAQARA